jgi:hypothetical protein
VNGKLVERSEAGEAQRRVRKKEEMSPGKATSLSQKIENAQKEARVEGRDAGHGILVTREAVTGRLEVVARRETLGKGSRNGERSRRKDEIRETNDCMVTRSVFQIIGQEQEYASKKKK